MNLGDGFSRRKQIESELETWTNRLRLAGRITTKYQTKEIEGEKKFIAIPGTKNEYLRHYTIEECNEKIKELIEEDRKLAMRISITNQKAKAQMKDLEGNDVELTIPALLVLKNDIAPKLERAAQSIPKLNQNSEVMEKASDYSKWRTVYPFYKTKQSLSEQGHKIEEEYIDYFNVEEVMDFGYDERRVNDEIDKIHDWQHRLKEAINQANKTELVD
jgi:preprotein translocase subunit SecD